MKCHGNAKKNRYPEIYPNPAAVKCGVRCAQCENELCKVTITDLYGRKVKDIFTGKFPAGGIDADLTGLPAGVFFISVHTGEGVILKKLIIL